MKLNKIISIFITLTLVLAMFSVPVTADNIYTEENGWLVNGGVEQENGKLSVPSGSANAIIYKPNLEANKKYSITYDISGLGLISGSWDYQFIFGMSAGGEEMPTALMYRMGGDWRIASGNSVVASGNNGINEIIIDMETGEWSMYVIGNMAQTGTFADTTDFTLKFYHWGSMQDPYISDVQVTEIPKNLIYTSENGWTLNGGIEQPDGRLSVPAGSTKAVLYKPNLEEGKKYSIKYDVTGLSTDGGGWDFQFFADMSAGGVDVGNVLAYRMAGKWIKSSNDDTLVARGTDGTNEIIIDMATGEWSTYALGALAQRGTLADTSDLTIKFYHWGSMPDPYISNVTIKEKQVSRVSISATVEGDGTVAGVGTYEVGESITLTATPEVGGTFLGWYDGNTKVSGNLNYTFTVTEEKTYIAKFAVDTKEYETLILACTDFQNQTGSAEGAETVESIIDAIEDDGILGADAFFCCGDYANTYNETEANLPYLKNAVIDFVPDEERHIYVQGNHDSPIGTSGLAKSGDNDPESGDYGVFVINEDDYMWFNDDLARIINTSKNLADYLNEKLEEGYDKPIFVLSHLPLYKSLRTINEGAAQHANQLFHVLNQAGEQGLNIIFMFGHDHSSGHETYLGGSAVYLAKGDSINVPQGSITEFKKETLNFTYLNAGYVGYCNSSADDTLTMTLFGIDVDTDTVDVYRYDEDGLHNLKSAGILKNQESTLGYEADTTVYTSPQTINLTDANYENEIQTLLHAITVTTTGSGVVTGEGIYDLGDSVTLTATPNYGYEFAGWYYGETKVSDDATYTFNITETRRYTAKFEQIEESLVYTSENGWTLGGAVEQIGGMLRIPSGSSNAAIYNPKLESGKKYSITYDVTGLSTVGGSWDYQFILDITGLPTALMYRMGGDWRTDDGNKVVTSGSDGTNEVIIDMETGEYSLYVLGALAKSGTLDSTLNFALRFYHWGSMEDPYISNVQVKELRKNIIYTSENGWTVNGGAEQEDGSINVPAGSTKAIVYKPNLSKNKKYSITYDVTGLSTDGDGFAYQFFADMSAGGVDIGNVLTYRMAGKWVKSSTNDSLVTAGTDGTNEIIIDMRTGEWSTYALGNLSQSGTLADTTDFTIKFYHWGSMPDPYISNVQIRECVLPAPVITDDSTKIFAGEVEQNGDILSAFSDTIKIDFGQEMWPDDMKDTHIYVQDENGEKVHGGEYSFKDGVLTIYFKNGFAGGTYTLVVNQVRNSGEASTLETYNEVFQVRENAADILSIKKGNVNIENLSQWVPGNVKIHLNHRKSAEVEPEINLIVGYYSSAGVLVHADYVKASVSEATEGFKYVVDYMVPSLTEEYAQVQFMVCDSFRNMMPLSAPLNISAEGFVKQELNAVDAEGKELKVSVSKNLANQTVSVQTESSKNDVVTIQVLPVGITPEMIETDVTSGADTEYVISVIAGEDGVAKHTFTLAFGAYNIYVTSGTINGAYSETLSFVSEESYKTLIEELMLQDKSAFLTTVNKDDNKAVLGFDIDIYSDSAVNRYFDEFKSSMSTTDYELNLRNFKKCALVEKINTNQTVDALEYVKNIYNEDSTLIEYINKYVTTSEAKEYFEEKMRTVGGTAISSADELENVAKKALVLTVVRYPVEDNNIQLVMAEYKLILGLSSVVTYASVFRALSGNVYNTAEELVADYKKLIGNENGSGGGSGGGSSGGSKVTPPDNSMEIIPLPNSAGQTQNIKIFADIDTVEWAYEAIEELYKAGVVSGKEPQKFYPNDNVSREEFVKMLVAAFDMKLVGDDLNFEDISKDAWYYDYVKTAYIAGAVSGISDTMFGTGKDITRQDICAMTYRMLNVCDIEIPKVREEMIFADSAEILDYAKDAVTALQIAGVISGNEAGSFMPRTTATRAETAQIIYGVLKLIKEG